MKFGNLKPILCTLFSFIVLSLVPGSMPCFADDETPPVDRTERLLPEGSVIPVGVGALLSGEEVSIGEEIVRGAEVFIANNPTAFDRQWEIIPLDDRCDIAVTVEQAKAFCESVPKPVAVIGYMCSPGSIAVLDLHRSCKIPLLNVTSRDPRLIEEQGWALRFWSPWIHQGLMAAKWAKTKALSQMLIVREDDAISEAISEAFVKTLNKIYPRTEVRTVPLESAERSDFNLIPKTESPPLVYYIGEGWDIEALWAKLSEHAMNRSWILDDRVDTEFLERVNALPRKVYRIEIDLPTGEPKGPAEKFFRGGYQKPCVYTLAAYDAMAVLAEAFQKTAKPGPAGLAWSPEELLENVKQTKIDGMTGPVAFDDLGERLNASGQVFQWRKNEWQSVWSGKLP